MSEKRLRLGVLLNPYAGLGGPAALKGSDTLPVHLKDQESRAAERAARALAPLKENQGEIELFTAPGIMGQDLLERMGVTAQCVGELLTDETCAGDSERIVAQMADKQLDLILFIGGDGTARNVVNGVQARPEQACLGIPAGVKMHSAVFAINPEAGADVIRLLLSRGLVDIRAQEVRDIDEELFRQGQVRSKYYGELWVPDVGQFVQASKNSGREVEELVLADIAAELAERIEDEHYYLIGPGTTPKCLLDELGLDGTLLGFDILHGQELIARDVDAKAIEALLSEFPGMCRAIITPIGGQGHLLGRGNQQLSPQALKALGRDHLWVVACKSKITELEQRPLLVDSNDPELDRSLSGYIPVLCGYRDTLYYPIGLQ